MDNPVKQLLKRWLPPVLQDFIAEITQQRLRLRGPYGSWAQASAVSQGYSDENILAKAKEATLLVKNGKAIGERDTVLFDYIPYSFPMLACLLRVALAEKGNLRVLDFGGALGSSYFQCREFLSQLHELRWYVIEQPHFVSCGQDLISDDKLSFHFDIDDCLAQEQPNLALLSSVIQYLEKPYAVLEQLNCSGIPYILFDRTPCAPDDKEVLSIQIVPPKIYPASYPAWIFKQQNLLNSLSNYNLLVEFDSAEGCVRSGGLTACYKGFLLQRCKV